jgi:ribosomal RNA-processing protein 9
VIQWDLRTGKQQAIFAKIPPTKKGKGKGKQRATQEEIEGHSDELWALSVSSDGKYVATGGKDRCVGVWDVVKGVWLKGFRGHKDSISVCMVHLFTSLTHLHLFRAWPFGKGAANYIPPHTTDP